MSQQEYALTTDPRQISNITSMRVMVSSALLYTFTIHYVFLAIASFFREDVKKQRLYDMGRRLSLYGMASLLSVNFLQYGIYHAIMAWVLLLTVLIINAIGLMREVQETKKNISILIYYIFVFIWFFGILFFYLFNALSK